MSVQDINQSGGWRTPAGTLSGLRPRSARGVFAVAAAITSLDLDGIRVAHAAWQAADIDYIQGAVKSHGDFTEDFLLMAEEDGSRLQRAIENVLKGPELKLPEDFAFESWSLLQPWWPFTAIQKCSGNKVHLSELIVSLRNFIRKSLDLETISPELSIPHQGPLRPTISSGTGSGGGRGEGSDKDGGGRAGSGMAMGAGGSGGVAVGLQNDGSDA